MKILYGAPASVFVRKPRILLVEKQIQFRVEPVNPMLDLSAEFKAINPLGKIPVFQDLNYVISDSSTICAYIDKKYTVSTFYPDEPEALGKVLWLEEFADTALFSAIAPFYYQTVLVPLYRNRDPDLNLIKVALTEKLPSVADYLEQQIVGKKYFISNRFTIADVAIVSVFLNMHFSGFPLAKEKWPNLSRYLNRQFERDSFKACIKDVETEIDKLKALSTV